MQNQTVGDEPEYTLRPRTIAETTAILARYLQRQRETQALEPHEDVAELFPKMSDEEFRGLEEDIAANGQLDPITVQRGKVIDGLNRLAACRKLGRPVKTVEWDGEGSPVAFAVSKNLHHRHLDAGQRAISAARITNLTPGRPPGKAQECAVTQAEAAERLGVSRRSVQQAVKVCEKGIPGLAAAVTGRELSLNRAAAIADLPPAEQAEALASRKAAAASPGAKAKPTAGACVGASRVKPSHAPAPPAAPAVTPAGDEPDLTAESRSKAVPLRAELADPALFDLEAALWYACDRVYERRLTAASGVPSGPDRGVRNGRLWETFRRVLRPDEWPLCTGCEGRMVGADAGPCPNCQGHGFLTKHKDGRDL